MAGPASSAPGDDPLAGRLDRLGALLRAQGAPFILKRRLGPSADVVAARLAEADIAPKAELITWFGWQDGTASRYRADLFHRWRLLGLDEALRGYRRAADQGPSDSPPLPWWPTTWLPFAEGDDAYLVLDVAGPAAHAPVHHSRRYQGVAGVESGNRTRPEAASLADFVDDHVRAVEFGALYWDAERSRWEGTGQRPDGLPTPSYLGRAAWG